MFPHLLVATVRLEAKSASPVISQLLIQLVRQGRWGWTAAAAAGKVAHPDTQWWVEFDRQLAFPQGISTTFLQPEVVFSFTSIWMNLFDGEKAQRIHDGYILQCRVFTSPSEGRGTSTQWILNFLGSQAQIWGNLSDMTEELWDVTDVRKKRTRNGWRKEQVVEFG